jgi:hypothetical protein
MNRRASPDGLPETSDSGPSPVLPSDRTTQVPDGGRIRLLVSACLLGEEVRYDAIGEARVTIRISESLPESEAMGTKASQLPSLDKEGGLPGPRSTRAWLLRSQRPT